MSEHDEREDYDEEPWKGRASSDRLVRWQARSFLVFGLFQFAASLVVLTIAIIVMSPLPTNVGTDNKTIALVGGLVGVPLNFVVVFGAIEMAALRKYRWAVAGTLFGLFSFPVIFLAVLSLPIRIWALVVLCNPDVRARFEAVASNTISSG